MLRIRLRRTGKKHQPHYRLVVAEHTAPLTGKFVALLGHYNPRTKELVTKNEEILAWMDKGAKPSNTVARLLERQGLKHKQIVIHKYPERPSKKAADEAAEAGGNTPTQATPEATGKVAEESEATTDTTNAEEAKPEEIAPETAKETSKPEEETKDQDSPPQEGSENK